MKILVVDENETALTDICSLLRELGHEVVSIKNPIKARDMYQRELPDLVILEMVMTGLSGYDCARQMRSCDRKDTWAPIIFVSETLDEESIIKGMEAGADDYLSKPISDIMLQAKIKIIERISEMRLKLIEYNRLLDELSIMDSLTHISNRHHFEKLLHITFADAIRHQQKFALLFIDLNNFKTVNDTLGNHIGDLVLIQAAKRIKNVLRKQDILARLGSDEFAVIITNSENTLYVGDVADKILRALRSPFTFNKLQTQVTASIGIACYPDTGKDVEALIKNADVAMYKAKAIGRNNFVYFTDELNEQYTKKIKCELELKDALKNRQFSLHYQPKYELRTKKITGIEALIRWNHPISGTISPEQFIPIAEETGLIIPIGKWVIDTACQQFASWLAAGYDDFVMEINL